MNTCVDIGNSYRHDLEGLYHLTLLSIQGRSGAARMRYFTLQYRTRPQAAWKEYIIDGVVKVTRTTNSNKCTVRHSNCHLNWWTYKSLENYEPLM